MNTIVGNLKAENIVGELSAEAYIVGIISSTENIVGEVSLPLTMEKTYLGAYTVVPKANETTVLETKYKIMKDNVTVTEIPYYEVSNDNGCTVYIGKEVILYGDQ